MNQDSLSSLDLKAKLIDILDKIDLKNQKEELTKLEMESVAPDLWSNEEKAKSVLSGISKIKNTIESAEKLEMDLNTLIDLETLSKDTGDTSLEREISILKATVAKKLSQLEIYTFLSGKYDSSEAIVTIRSGQGGTEAMDWASMLARMYTRYFERKDWAFETVDYIPGEEAGIKSVTYLVHGQFAFGLLKHEKGTHRLVRQSPFNADKLRQTSFAGVEVVPVLDEQSDIQIRDEDLEFEASRSSGAGGQNVNKVSTAVRIKHLPTGIVVECQTQRYQDANRKIAMQILKSKLWEIEENKRQEELAKIRGAVTQASWGTQIRSYVLHPYKLVKDTRTDYESTDPDTVLDGDIDQFIETELKFFTPKRQSLIN